MQKKNEYQNAQRRAMRMARRQHRDIHVLEAVEGPVLCSGDQLCSASAARYLGVAMATGFFVEARQ